MAEASSSSQLGRKRKAHKRSRHGCLTCKQRHIRCDELKPVCTNCLTRGGECGYAAEVVRATSDPPSSATTAMQPRMVAYPSSPADPFDTLPIKMPYRSLELFNHFVNYRIFTRTAVPKSASSQCVGIALSNPDTFRACLIMSAFHYSRISGGLRESEMEETYLYHKLEAMRLVNQQVADPATRTSDGCLSLIAGLALAESGMGDSTAAEAHINGLYTLIDMKHPEEWQHRFYGMLQRVVLMAGSFIAASRDPSLESKIIETDAMTLCYPHPHFTKPTSALLSTTQVQATSLSPFYLTSTPCLEACKADVEGEVLFNALGRLTSLCFAPYNNSNNEIISLLISDTESYTVSLLFQPDSPSSSPTTASNPPRRQNKKHKGKDHLYNQTPPVYFPSSSRVWAAAGYLYTHFILSPLWTQISQDATTDPDLLWYLLNTLQEDITKTEEAMKIGAYSPELWIWKVINGAYAIHLSLGDQLEDLMMGVMNTNEVNQELQEIFEDVSSTTTPAQTAIWPGLIYTSTAISSPSSQDGSDDSLPDFESPDQGYGIFSEQEQGQSQVPAESPPPRDYLHLHKVFFNQKIAVWSQTAKVVDWEGAKQMLGRIVWPQQASTQMLGQFGSLETTMKGIWTEAVSSCGFGFGEVLSL